MSWLSRMVSSPPRALTTMRLTSVAATDDVGPLAVLIVVPGTMMRLTTPHRAMWSGPLVPSMVSTPFARPAVNVAAGSVRSSRGSMDGRNTRRCGLRDERPIIRKMPPCRDDRPDGRGVLAKTPRWSTPINEQEVQGKARRGASETPPPNPLPAAERGSKPNGVSSSPPLRFGEGVGGRGFATPQAAGLIIKRRPAPDGAAPCGGRAWRRRHGPSPSAHADGYGPRADDA